MLSDILSASRSIYMLNNSNVVNDQYRIEYIQIQEMICSLSDSINNLTNDQRRIDNEVHHSQTLLQTAIQNFSSLKSSFEELVSRTEGVKIMHDLLAQQLWSLKRLINNALPASVDGTLIWKITNIKSKLGTYRHDL
jgi:predicted transcriptional regulator